MVRSLCSLFNVVYLLVHVYQHCKRSCKFDDYTM